MTQKPPKLMKLYHFSVTFEGLKLPHHGQTVTANSDFVLMCKAELTRKLKIWNLKAEDVTSFEIYDNDRNILFNWKK